MLLDQGRLQDSESYLAGTARRGRGPALSSTAAEIGAVEGDSVIVSTQRGAITLPLAIADLPDRVVWLPLNSTDSAVYERLGVTTGALVSIGAPR